MNIRILGCESLGVRSLACVVESSGGKILIDPGVALGPRRFRLGPHALEVEAAKQVQSVLREELSGADVVIFTHFHGDHHPMVEADESQLSAESVLAELKQKVIFAKAPGGISRNQRQRRLALEEMVGESFQDADGESMVRAGFTITFSGPVPHGEPGNKAGSVIMVKVSIDGRTFVHGSDNQLLNDEAMNIICGWKPDVLFCAGPPLYIFQNRPDVGEGAAKRLERLSSACGTVIIDHHILRSRSGEEWLDSIAGNSKHGNIRCAADFMGKLRRLLEADRKELYLVSK